MPTTHRALSCVLVAITAAAVTGKPHQSISQDDYTRAILAQYFPSAATSKMVEITPTELAEPASFRSSRSDEPAVAKPAVFPDVTGHRYGGSADDHFKAAAAAAASKTMYVPPVADQSRGNDTSPAVTVEKLTAFYDTLKGQHEKLAQQQLQQQMYDQQQRRQQEFALVQQQIQQQFYQQQQHAMLMLNQLRKNPAFVGQMVAYADRNGTAAAVTPETVPEVKSEVKTVVDSKRPPPPTKERDQNIVNHIKFGRDGDALDGFGTKRLDSKQIDDNRRPTMNEDEDDNDGEELFPSTGYWHVGTTNWYLFWQRFTPLPTSEENTIYWDVL